MEKWQIHWCMQHDWIVRPDYQHKTVVVMVRERWPCGYWHQAEVTWIGTFEELKEWAGY